MKDLRNICDTLAQFALHAPATYGEDIFSLARILLTQGCPQERHLEAVLAMTDPTSSIPEALGGISRTFFARRVMQAYIDLLTRIARDGSDAEALHVQKQVTRLLSGDIAVETPVARRIKSLGRDDFLRCVPLSRGLGYVAYFTSDIGLRAFGQMSLVHDGKAYGLVILPDGRIPRDEEASALLKRHNIRFVA